MQFCRQIPRRLRGFTLTELVIAVAMVTILAAIAIPSYRDSVRRSHRTDGTGTLLTLAAEQEKFHLQNNTYTALLGEGGLEWRHKDGTGFISRDGYYQISVTAADVNTFELQAVPKPGQDGDTKCSSLTIDESGNRAAKDDGDVNTTDLCWR